MSKIIDELGTLNIDDIIVNQPSFIKIMEDGVVTDEELQEQADRIEQILHKLEEMCNDKQADLIRELLAELSVFVAVKNNRM